MALLTRHASSSLALLLLGLLFIICHLKLALASSSGGVMGGGFFHDSDSSSSESLFTNDRSEHVMVQREHDSPASPDDSPHEHASHGGGVSILFLIFMFGLFLFAFCKDTNGNAITVLKLQVAMLGGTGSSIQRDLTRIAQAADTSSPEGVSNLLSETILALHQHPGYSIAGYSFVDLKRSREEGQKCYNQLSHEERAKFDEETLVNLNSKEKISTRSQSANVFSNEYTMLDVKKSKEGGQKFEEEELLNGFGNEYIVGLIIEGHVMGTCPHTKEITILVAAKGVHKLPSINGTDDLKKTLQKLRSLLSSNLLAGEVLWTPQKEDDTLSEQELIADYPQLAKNMKSFLVKKQE